MKLDEWFNQNEIEFGAFAALIDVNPATLYRLRHQQLRPSWGTMLAILHETNGVVTPNDFVDLSDSSPRGKKRRAA